MDKLINYMDCVCPECGELANKIRVFIKDGYIDFEFDANSNEYNIGYDKKAIPRIHGNRKLYFTDDPDNWICSECGNKWERWTLDQEDADGCFGEGEYINYSSIEEYKRQ